MTEADKRQSTHDDESQYTLSISLSVLDDLGIRLYSNIPAVLSEVVANAWDADATKVTIRLDRDNDSIVIEDNGLGMTPQEINDKYLNVGYRRRDKEETITTPSGRQVMGRKGIGKLSIFSIAETLEIHTVKDGVAGALRMNSADIREIIEAGKDQYKPVDLGSDVVKLSGGTRLMLSDLKRLPTIATDDYLRRRLSRRFSVIGSNANFSVTINGQEVSARDREYYDLLQFMWHFGEDSDEFAAKCSNLSQHFSYDVPLEIGDRTVNVRGWLGTLHESRGLDDESKTIVVFANGRLVHENILSDLDETGVYASFVVGEIDADFLDDNEQEDIVTTARQSLQQHSERYIALKKYVHALLKRIQNRWRDLRIEEGADRLLKQKGINAWYETMEGDHKRIARQLLGKIDGLGLSDATAKREMVKASMLAFSRFALEQQLSRLDNVKTSEELTTLIETFGRIDELEKVHYYQIATGRLKVIRAFENLVDDDKKEKVIQEHLYKNLWLLDPSWEMASGTSRKEERITTEFKAMEDRLSKEERAGRVDIRYRNITGTHVIIELKRYSARVSAFDLANQIHKYRTTLLKCLHDNFPDDYRDGVSVRCICVIGSTPGQGEETTTKSLAAVNGEYKTYDQLIESARKSYEDFLNAQAAISRLLQIIDSVDEDFGD